MGADDVHQPGGAGDGAAGGGLNGARSLCRDLVEIANGGDGDGGDGGEGGVLLPQRTETILGGGKLYSQTLCRNSVGRSGKYGWICREVVRSCSCSQHLFTIEHVLWGAGAAAYKC